LAAQLAGATPAHRSATTQHRFTAHPGNATFTHTHCAPQFAAEPFQEWETHMQTDVSTLGEKSIFFVTVNLNKQVHEQALGFTSQVYRFAYAGSPEEAQKASELWLKSQGCDVRNAQARIAVQQDVNTYTFPHQIINLPQHFLDSFYDRRDYPPTWRDRARIVKLEVMH